MFWIFFYLIYFDIFDKNFSLKTRSKIVFHLVKNYRIKEQGLFDTTLAVSLDRKNLLDSIISNFS
jgi:hypothetical protein